MNAGADLGEPRHAGIHAVRTPGRAAIIMAGSGEVITFAGYEALSNRCAHLLRQRGLRRGDNVAIAMENHALYLPLAWGALRAGLRLTTIATHLTPREADYILHDCGASALFTSRAKVDQVATLATPIRHRFMADGAVAGFDATEECDRSPDCGSDCRIRLW